MKLDKIFFFCCCGMFFIFMGSPSPEITQNIFLSSFFSHKIWGYIILGIWIFIFGKRIIDDFETSNH